ncbi:hypothetical protein, partial [Lysinibacillus capsici]|uniref:hypothetical protein n=1 Tax=Lysinibacillus capsici TaxID=2115968 RepID=UPI00289E25D6
KKKDCRQTQNSLSLSTVCNEDDAISYSTVFVFYLNSAKLFDESDIKTPFFQVGAMHVFIKDAPLFED